MRSLGVCDPALHVSFFSGLTVSRFIGSSGEKGYDMAIDEVLLDLASPTETVVLHSDPIEDHADLLGFDHPFRGIELSHTHETS